LFATAARNKQKCPTVTRGYVTAYRDNLVSQKPLPRCSRTVIVIFFNDPKDIHPGQSHGRFYTVSDLGLCLHNELPTSSLHRSTTSFPHRPPRSQDPFARCRPCFSRNKYIANRQRDSFSGVEPLPKQGNQGLSLARPECWLSLSFLFP
jgi:hypothetical protein